MPEIATAGDTRPVYDIMRRISAGADLSCVLEAIVDAVRRASGFDVVCLSLLNRGMALESAAVAGPEEARTRYAGRHLTLDALETELAFAEAWGAALFTAAGGPTPGLPPGLAPGPTPEQTQPGAREARNGDGPATAPWHPSDMLWVPLRTPEDELLGMIEVDAPLDGRRPDRERVQVLEMYAELAGVALTNARYAEELEDRLRLAAAVEAIHAAASKGRDVAGILQGSAEPIAMALAVDSLFLRAFDTEDGKGDHDGGQGVRWPRGEPTPPEIIDITSRNSRLAWENHTVTTRVRFGGSITPAQVWTQDIETPWSSQPVGGVSVTESPMDGVPHRPVAGGLAGWVRRSISVPGDAPGPEEMRLQEFLSPAGASATLLAPIGAGADCLGYLVAVRGRQDEWTPYEVEAAAQAARHLGQAVLNARVLEREQSVVEQLDALDRYTGELITTVSHELRTPLTSIKGHLEIIQDDPESAPAESFRVIGRNMDRMQGLINDLLTLHRLSEDSPLDRGSVVDLAQVARDAVAALRVRADEKGVALALVAPPGPLLIGGDRDELERVALNLTSNAITYTPAAGRVRVECQRSDRFVRLIVSDSGIGISKADQEELFTDFYRTTNPDALSMPGTGLGLSIVRRIVQRHTGSIRLESDLGQGSTFTVRLPVSHV